MTSLFIPGVPVPWPRPRAVRFKDGRISIYEAPKVRQWKGVVAKHLLTLGVEPLEGPVDVDLAFHFVRPKSHYTSKGRLTKSAPPACTSLRNGDCDNLAKAVLDAANGILFGDDRQVVKLTATKSYAAKSGVLVVWRAA